MFDVADLVHYEELQDGARQLGLEVLLDADNRLLELHERGHGADAHIFGTRSLDSLYACLVGYAHAKGQYGIFGSDEEDETEPE